MFTGEQLQPAGTDVSFAEQHQANTLFGTKQGLVQPLDQAFRRPGAQHGHQADSFFRLPGELHWLPFQLLPETVAVQGVTGDASAHHRHQRQLLTQTQLARQTCFIEQLQRAVGHLGGIAKLQQLAVGMDANG